MTSTDHFHGFESIKRSNCIGSEGACNASDFSFGVWPNAETSYKKRSWEIGNAAIPLYFVDWISLFESIHQIALRSTEEHVRLEALSIMNVILMRTNASTEREMFGHKKIFEGIALLLSKETGLCVRKEAVRLLYLLLNCPKLLVMFSSGYKGENPSAEDDREESASAFKGFDMILEGFADCLASSSNSVEELDLCRNVIIVLAFLASSGKFGFEILVVHKLSRDRNFLLLILQMLISETDMESTLQSECAGIFEKRTLLMREALILLNRLASNPVSSATVLRMLTNSRDMASLTVDVAKRLSRKEQVLQGSDAASQKIRESEIIDLARAFKKRIFNFLGDSLS